MSKRYVNTYTDPDGVKHYPTPAIDKLTEIDAVDPDLDELVIHDNSQTTGQREKRVKPSKLWPMRARTILGRARSSGGPQVIKPEQMLATTSRAGFMAADDKAIVDALYNPNILVDGNFEYWDEGTSGAAGIYGPTMAYIWEATWERSTNVPDGSKYSVKIARTSIEMDIFYFVPAYIGRQLAGNDITLSWWAQNVANVSYTRCFIQSFDAEDTPSAVTTRHSGTSFTTIDGTWRKFTQTFTLHADCANGFRLRIRLGHSSSLALDGRIAQVKLEPGTVATPFYQGPEERERVNRYYWKTYNPAIIPGSVNNVGCIAWSMVGVSRTYGWTNIYPPAQFRTTPSVTIYSTDSGAAGKLYNVDASEDTDGVTLYYEGVNKFTIAPGSGDSLNLGDRLMAHVVADSRFYP